MDDARNPHPKNAPGPFYVVDGCCMSCAVWTAVAPDLFAFDDNHCYVRQQPRTRAEMDRMAVALWSAEVSCIRYRGNDPAIFERLGAMGEPDLCDSPPAEGIPAFLRNHVAFDAAEHRPNAVEEAVADFRSFLLKSNKHSFRTHDPSDRATWFEFAWREDNYHRVDVSNPDRGGRRILMVHSPIETIASRGISNLLNEWLEQSSRFGNQRWYTAEQWAQQTGGSPTPW